MLKYDPFQIMMDIKIKKEAKFLNLNLNFNYFNSEEL